MSKIIIDDKKFWEDVYYILVEECGADMNSIESFSELNGDFREWRFIGYLGFGGKVWNNNDDIYVNCYPEDVNAERKKMIEEANKRLYGLLMGYLNQ